MKTIIALLLILCTLNAGAQETPQQETTGISERAYIIIECTGLRVREVTTVPPLPYEKPLFGYNKTSHILVRNEIAQLPYTNIRDMVALFPGVYQLQRGRDVNIMGSRIDGNLYVIDGMRIMQ